MAHREEKLRPLLKHNGPARRLRLAYVKAARDLARRGAKKTKLNLALQGGGALGAFTWGVLDRLSYERLIDVRAFSGASAGALNAAVFLSGLKNGGRGGARNALRRFWTEVANAASFANFLFPPMLLPGQLALIEDAFNASSRYGLSPMKINPLKDILARHVDLDALRAEDAPRLYIAATNVLTGRARIFTNDDLSVDALLASACIPNLHPTVMIDAAPYWDGGFSANPPIMPLMENDAERILLVRLMRSGTGKAPRTTNEIDDYIKNHLFTRPLDDELERVALLPRASRTPIDEIDASDADSSVSFTSQPTPRLVNDLFEKGAAAAGQYFAGLIRAHQEEHERQAGAAE